MKFHLATCVRNEGPYLLDWIIYHRALGFDSVTVYSNDNTDGSDEILSSLQQRGLIQWINRSLQEGESPQLTAYRDFSSKLFSSAENGCSYLAWFDCDEYLVLRQDDDVSGLMSRFKHPDALLINWRHFGSSGQLAWENTPTPLRFCHRAEQTDLDRHFKAISKIDSTLFSVINNHRPLLLRNSVAKVIYASDQSDDPVPSLEVIRGVSPVKMPNAPVFHEACYLAHYATRSLDEFSWKKSRGNGRLPLNAPRAHFFDNYFAKHDLNEVYDPLPSEFYKKVMSREVALAYVTVRLELEPLIMNSVRYFLRS
jgi:hypothetical protein